MMDHYRLQKGRVLESQKNYDFLRSDFDVPKLEQTSSAEFRFELCHFIQISDSTMSLFDTRMS